MKVLSFLVLLFGIHGCAITTDAVNAQSDSSPQVLIARDFARVLAQIPSLSPAKTTLSMVQSKADSAGFKESLQAALVKEGYALRFVDKDKVANTVSYKVEDESLLG